MFFGIVVFLRERLAECRDNPHNNNGRDSIKWNFLIPIDLANNYKLILLHKFIIFL